MNIKPSITTAAAAGVWTSFGLVPLHGWVYQAGVLSTVAWLAVFTVFLFLPFIFLVVGRNRHKFSQNWIGNPHERAEYMLIVKRVGAWLGAAAVTGAMIYAGMTILA